MAKKKDNFYGLSESYLRKMRKDILLNFLMTLMFFVVFNILFQKNTHYNIIRYLLIVIFTLITIGVVWAGGKRVQKKQSIGYWVKSDGLEYYDGKKTVYYPWTHFRKVVIDRNRFSLPFPYCFHTTDGKFYMHRELGNPEVLIQIVLDKIRPYADIDPEIPDKLESVDHNDWLAKYTRADL